MSSCTTNGEFSSLLRHYSPTVPERCEKRNEKSTVGRGAEGTRHPKYRLMLRESQVRRFQTLTLRRENRFSFLE